MPIIPRNNHAMAHMSILGFTVNQNRVCIDGAKRISDSHGQLTMDKKGYVYEIYIF